VNVGDTVRLDGSRSSDPAGKPLAYIWELTDRPSGSRAELAEPITVSPTFVADQAGSFTVRLYVSDDVSLSAPAYEHIQASSRDAGVVPDAGPLLDGSFDAGFTTFTMQDEDGGPILTIAQGPPGPPATVGCADGRREGLLDMTLFPNIAACIGTWSGQLSLRLPATGQACGNDLAKTCSTAADLCASGWHLCASGGSAIEVTHNLTPDQCDFAGGGRYVAATSHCLGLCVYDPSGNEMYPCNPIGDCAEPVCCGEACRNFGECIDAIWPGRTHITNGRDQGCGMITSVRAGGVLCCR
jgi:hypothetical protein